MCRACMKSVVNANPLWNLVAVIRACNPGWLKHQEAVQCLTLGTVLFNMWYKPVCYVMHYTAAVVTR